MEAAGSATREEKLREEARRRVKKKRDFRTSAVGYVLVNAFLVGIWALSGAGFFWPAFVLAGWGLGLATQAWDAYGRKPVTDADVQREMDKLRG